MNSYSRHEKGGVVTDGFWKKTINWIPQEEISAEWIRDFKRAFFE